MAAVRSQILCFTKNVVRNVSYCANCLKKRHQVSPLVVRSVRMYSEENTTNVPASVTVEKTQTVSKAMEAYIKRTEKHDKFMADEVSEYNIGKRHLANIMDVDADSFEQADIDKAIEYLLPSGLFDKKARPKLKHPEDILPKTKAAQFGIDGRPFHYLYYTMKPNYYQIMHETALVTDKLKEYQETLASQGVTDPPPTLQLQDSEWLDQKSLTNLVLENLTDEDYERFVIIMDHLASQPYAYKEKDHIMKYRKKFFVQSLSVLIKEPYADVNGRKYMDATGERRWAKAQVRVWQDGSGQFTINNSDIRYFKNINEREQVMYPIQFVNMLGKVDVEATVTDSGPSAQAGAIRLAIARALTSMVDGETAERLRMAGLLTFDLRQRERKKPGQRGARRKFTWKKR